MIRVAHVITGLGVGGAEMMLVKLVTAMRRDRFESRVIVLSDELALADRLRDAGIDVTALGVTPSLRNSAAALRRLVRTLRERRPHVVQTWLYHADLLGGIGGRSIGAPVIWNIRNNSIASGLSRRTVAVGRLCAIASFIVPATIVSCSHAGMEAHIAIGYRRSRFQVIPNGMDLSSFKPDAELRTSVREELGVAADVPLVGMIARLHPQKDHANFFAAAGRLIQTHPNVRFVLAGLGLEPQNAAVMSMIRAAGIEQHTILLSLRSDIPRLLCGLDIHVLSSWDEGFPNVVGEAMAAGVPCVVTDVGDAALIVGDTGRTVPARDPEAIARAMRELLDLPAAEFAALRVHARERVASHFSIEATVSQYEELYERTARSSQ